MVLAQVYDAYERGVRPARVSRQLLDLRRAEAVLVGKEDYAAAHKVWRRRGQGQSRAEGP